MSHELNKKKKIKAERTDPERTVRWADIIGGKQEAVVSEETSTSPDWFIARARQPNGGRSWADRVRVGAIVDPQSDQSLPELAGDISTTEEPTSSTEEPSTTTTTEQSTSSTTSTTTSTASSTTMEPDSVRVDSKVDNVAPPHYVPPQQRTRRFVPNQPTMPQGQTIPPQAQMQAIPQQPQMQAVPQYTQMLATPQQPHGQPCYYPFVYRAPQALMHAHKLAQLSDTLAQLSHQMEELTIQAQAAAQPGSIAAMSVRSLLEELRMTKAVYENLRAKVYNCVRTAETIPHETVGNLQYQGQQAPTENFYNGHNY